MNGYCDQCGANGCNCKIGPLTPTQAKHSLANRFGRVADRARQLATKFGIRPYRVFLVWTQWSGAERGEGQETIFQKIEILPTPRVTSMDRISLNFMTAGVLPIGSVQVDRISVHCFTQDELMGKVYRGSDSELHPLGNGKGDHVPSPYEFQYWIQEDGRGDNPAYIARFAPNSAPMRRAEQVDWTIVLTRVSEDPLRDGSSAIGTGRR